MKKINFIISFLIILLGVFNFFSFDDLNKYTLAYNQVAVTAFPSEVVVNQTVTIKTDSIPKCNSSTAICEWRWSGDVNKITTNNKLTTSFSTAGTKKVSVEIYVKDSKIKNGSFIKVTSGSTSINVLSSFSTKNTISCSLTPHQAIVYVSPNPANINQIVTIKTESIPECNSSTAICEWRWSGDVNKTTTNKQDGSWTTSFSTAGTKNIYVEVYVKDYTICGNNWIKIAYGNKKLTVIKDTPSPTPTLTPRQIVVYVSPDPANINETVTIKTDSIPECNSSTAICEWRWSGDVNKITTNNKLTTSFSTAGTKKIFVEAYIKNSTSGNNSGNNWIKIAYGNKKLTVIKDTPPPTPTLTPRQIVVYVSPDPANINETVTIKTDSIPECNSSTAICEWRWSGDVNKITTNNKLTTSFSTAGTKNIYVDVYIKYSTSGEIYKNFTNGNNGGNTSGNTSGNNWVKIAYGNKKLTVNNVTTETPPSTGGYWNVVIGETPTPTSTVYPTPTPTVYPTPTPTVFGTSTCTFTHFDSALKEKTCWINGKNGGNCYLSTNDGFNVNLAILANSYPDDIRINISVHQLNRLIDANTKVGNYQFVGQKIIHIATEDENCNEIDLENLATLTINYLNNDTIGFDENYFTIVHNPFIPYDWSLITTYKNPNLNSLSIFTAQFGYFGIVGLKPEQKVTGGISTTKTPLSPAFIAWYNPLNITEPKNLSSFYSLAALFDKIKNFDLSWYWISLLFNILLILWLLWMYAGKKLLVKSNNLNKINNGVINPLSFQTTPPSQNSPSQTMVYLTEEPKKDDKKESEDSEEEILRKLKEKLNHS